MNGRSTGAAPGAGPVREMFARVAPRYDLLNHLLSLNIDRLWRSAVSRRFRAVLERPGARVLDLCCGTGDLAWNLRRAGRALVIGSDFCHPMLTRAAKKFAFPLAEADALRLPFADATFDLVTVAFGLRNLEDYAAGLREMRRVLRSGGQIGILEFSEPTGPLMGPLYRFYSKNVLPKVGAAVSGDASAYTYLPESVARFPSAEELAAWMREMGFSDVKFEPFTGGIAYLHRGTKPA